MRFLCGGLLAVFLIACEGPAGPAGPEGPQGPSGPQGAPAEGILIEKSISASAYNEDGVITIRDSRITPESFRAVYVKVEGDGWTEYYVLDYMLIYWLWDQELETSPPAVVVAEGVVALVDPDRTLVEALDGNNLAILVAG